MASAPEDVRNGRLGALERLAAEQAALRRVATMVARDCPPEEVFGTVAEELGKLLDVSAVRFTRYESDGTGTLVAAHQASAERLPVGTNAALPKGSVIEQIHASGRPASVMDYSQVEGPIGETLRREGVGRAAGAPIVVNDHLWGALVVCATTDSWPSDTEHRVEQFAELVAMAISKVESRAKAKELAAEQSALRRVAELVAHHASAEEVFELVTKELGDVLGASQLCTIRFEEDSTATVVAARGPEPIRTPPGMNLPLPPGGVLEIIHRTGKPARVDEYTRVGGPIAAVLREEGVMSMVGGPIVVGGRLWGAMLVAANTREPLPPGSEDRVARFAELASTAIANTESRAKVEQLAAEQAALRRVAELVASQAPAEEVFELVTEELNRLLDVSNVGTARFESDGTATVMAVRGSAQDAFPRGMRVPLEGGSMIERVFRSGQPVHTENYDNVGGRLGTVMRELGAGWAAAGPIVVDGRLWGAMVVNSAPTKTYPPGAEQRVAQFTELISTAISNIESRAKVDRLVAEQSALRRVATLIANENSSDDEIFATLAEEIGVLFEVDASAILRYDSDAKLTIVAGWSKQPIGLPLGHQLPIEPGYLAAEVLRTGRPGRKDHGAAHEPGSTASLVRELGIRSAVASPIVVDGEIWGTTNVMSLTSEPLPPDIETRLMEFSRYAGMAVANAKTRADLTDSRARIVRAADEARRRFERDLHDGAQQRLVSLGLELRAAETTLSPESADVRRVLTDLAKGMNEVLDNLREISRGLHPAVLSEDGLTAALGALALRSSVPVELRLEIGVERFEEAVEVAAFYVATEAVTNTAKHAGARCVEISASRCDGWLELAISDDGTGGADPSLGSGLRGLIDRVEAIGGSIQIDSVPGRGTSIRLKLPTASPRT